jgi:peptide/nickel transport system permease protein
MKKVYLYLILFALLTAIFFCGAVLFPHSATLPSGGSLEAPSANHLLGTDNLGVDIFAQISVGFFRSMVIGLTTACLTFILGGVLGVMSGYIGGKFDAGVSFLINVMLSIPQLPVMIVIGAFFGQSTWNIILIIAIFSWAPIAKQLRAKTISVRSAQYIKLAKSYGGGSWYIIRRHMLRELLPLLTVNAIGVVGMAIVQESSLAFLGLSDPLAKSWGLMISRAKGFSGIFFTDFWKWWLIPPVLALICSTLCLRMLAKALENVWLKEV